MSAVLDEKAGKIVSSVKAAVKDDYSLLVNLYEIFQRNVKYDKNELKANSKGVWISPDSHNAYGAIINKEAVCDGFSSAFALLAGKLGFECMLVTGHSAYSSTSFTNHAWNIIKISDKYYHMDITWDARFYIEFGEYSYAYFALNDREIVNDHKWNKNTAPACSYYDFSYYSRNRLHADNTEQLNEIINAYGSKRSKVFRIKLSNTVPLPGNAGDYLAQKAANTAAKYTDRARISYSWNDNTRCFFAKIMN